MNGALSNAISGIGGSGTTRILVLGDGGTMGSVAARDLVERTEHEVVIGELRLREAQVMAAALGPRV